MLITSIERQKNNTERYSVFVDGEFVFGMSQVDILFFKLKENDEISKERLDYLLEKVVFEKSKNKALKCLAYSSKTEKQIVEKLKDDFSEDVIQKTMDFLKKYGYIDDEKYAKAFITDKIKFNGYGINKIKYELKNRGISLQHIENVLNENDFEDAELEKAKAIFIKKAQSKQISSNSDFKERQKLSAFMSRRGYSFDIINRLFREFFEENIDHEL